MDPKKTLLMAGAAASGMLLLILDAQTALSGAQQGIELCIKTVVPSLFPFFVLSILLTSSLSGRDFRALRPISALCGIPTGCEVLFLIGLLGGYPVGAQSVTQCWKDGRISRKDASRLLGFCSNAGPAFLFGMVASQFPQLWMTWALWGIHILSALTVGFLLPGRSVQTSSVSPAPPVSLSEALDRGLKSIARVCGWVILFRIILCFLQRWFLWRFPIPLQAAFSGILELSNGCCSLMEIDCIGLRFIVCSVILAFGGVCVAMQTLSVTSPLGLGSYFPGKLLQVMVSFNLSYFLQIFAFPEALQFHLPPVILTGLWLLFLVLKITVAFPRRMLYNPFKSLRGKFR